MLPLVNMVFLVYREGNFIIRTFTMKKGQNWKHGKSTVLGRILKFGWRTNISRWISSSRSSSAEKVNGSFKATVTPSLKLREVRWIVSKLKRTRTPFVFLSYFVRSSNTCISAVCLSLLKEINTSSENNNFYLTEESLCKASNRWSGTCTFHSSSVFLLSRIVQVQNLSWSETKQSGLSKGNRLSKLGVLKIIQSQQNQTSL